MFDNGVSHLRPEVAQAWRRARLSGLEPGMEVKGGDVKEIDRDSRLLTAAVPMLDPIAESLSDTHFSILLADREGRIVDRRLGSSSLATTLDQVCAIPGARYTEEFTGTNAIATAFETRQTISIVGTEHFFEPLKQFCCYGHPIIHPVTHRLEGVLDITGYAQESTDLLTPFAVQAAEAITLNLLNNGARSEQRMLAAFRNRTAHTRHAVLVVGGGVTMSNSAALDLFDPAVVREMSRDLNRDTGQCWLPTRTDELLSVEYTVLPGTHNAVLFEALGDQKQRPACSRVRTPPAADRLMRHRHHRDRVLIHGETGSGRSASARTLAGDFPLTLIDGGDLRGSDVAYLCHHDHHLVVIDGIHLLDNRTALALAQLLDTCPGWFCLTSAPLTELTGERAALATRCPQRWEPEPLRNRRHELPTLVSQLLKDHGSTATLTNPALAALRRHTWPGNLAELSSLLRELAQHHNRGVITEVDLPQSFHAPRRNLSQLEQAECDTIADVLQRHQGNKSQAAQTLGIGRTTLYRRLKQFDLQ